MVAPKNTYQPNSEASSQQTYWIKSERATCNALSSKKLSKFFMHNGLFHLESHKSNRSYVCWRNLRREMFDMLEEFEFPLHRIRPHMYVYNALHEHNAQFCIILSHLRTICERSGRCEPCPLFNVIVRWFIYL